jgi:hypothetical protein
MDFEVFDASPSASSLIEGLRDFGYTTETAAADIVDNSITAEALEIDIYADFNSGDPLIAFIDHGTGMSKSELHRAMRPGTRSPLDKRDTSDMGRFGLGLKTASFSQARQLTVVTKQDNKICAAEWDLDYVQEVDRWEVIVPKEIRTLPYLDQLKSKNGTLVLWRKIDRLGTDADLDQREREFTAAISRVVDHLSLVFHRFIQGTSNRKKKVIIRVNERVLEARDPFNSQNLKTQTLPPQTISYRGSTVVVRSYSLPHPKAIPEVEWRKFENSKGYEGSQGFYLYRLDRLIVAGNWFGLARKSQLTKLLRISLDIGNDQDNEWKINVLKAFAQPPREIREDLRRLLPHLQQKSKRTFLKRGRILSHPYLFPFWVRVESDESIQYQINGENPLIEAFRRQIDSKQLIEFDLLLAAIAKDFPIDTLFIDLGDHQEKVDSTHIENDAVARIAAQFVREFVSRGYSEDQMKSEFKAMQIFANSEQVVDMCIRNHRTNND